MKFDTLDRYNNIILQVHCVPVKTSLKLLNTAEQARIYIEYHDEYIIALYNKVLHCYNKFLAIYNKA